jgi:hypothetical protein
MLNNLKELLGFELWADEDSLGRVDDFYFDDSSWTIRYLVVDTQDWWEGGRRILVALAALSQSPDWINRRLFTRLSREEIKRSPDIDLEQPISRREEENLSSYFRWPAYWTGAETWTGPFGQILSGPIAWAEAVRAEAEQEALSGEQLAKNYHLYSALEVENYRIGTLEGESGYAEDFIFDAGDWILRYLVADTGTLLLPGKKVLIPPNCIAFLDWQLASVETSLHQRQIQASPAYDPSLPWSTELEQHFTRYFQIG